MRVCNICHTPVGDRTQWEGLNLGTGIPVNGKNCTISMGVVANLRTKRGAAVLPKSGSEKDFGFHVCKVCLNALILRAAKRIKVTKAIQFRLNAFPGSKPKKALKKKQPKVRRKR